MPRSMCAWHLPGNVPCWTPALYEVVWEEPLGKYRRRTCEFHLDRAIAEAIERVGRVVVELVT